jgi:hypothetical protein
MQNRMFLLDALALRVVVSCCLASRWGRRKIIFLITTHIILVTCGIAEYIGVVSTTKSPES